MRYWQEKLNTNQEVKSTCELTLNIDNDIIHYRGVFYIEFKKDNEPYGITFRHDLKLIKKCGDIFVTYEIENKKDHCDSFKSKTWIKKNNFSALCDLTEMGFFRGEKRRNFWGVKYNRALVDIFNLIKENLQKEFSGTFLENKEYWDSSVVNGLYDLIVDYHLFKKNIKGHDNVYNNIKDVYPKKKWLKLNDNKFLPAILDEHGIKSKYLIKELSNVGTPLHSSVNIRALIYLCNLFGKNYVDYIKRINWRVPTSTYFTRSKKHICKNEHEKKSLVKALNNYSQPSEVKVNNTLELIYDLFETRCFLENEGYKKLKIKFHDHEDIRSQLEIWHLMKKHFALGYMLRYKIPEHVINDIEQPIEINGNVYRPKVLLSDNDFCVEGMIMKNCMGKQFSLGAIFLFVALSKGNKRIDIQYRRGIISMSYAKANSPVPGELFNDAINILNERLLKYKDMTWSKEKYN